MLFGGEGIFNTVVTGPGKIILQSMPITNVAALLEPYINPKKNWVFHFSYVMHQKEIVHRGYLLIRTTISSGGLDWQRQLPGRGPLGDAPTVRPRIQ